MQQALEDIPEILFALMGRVDEHIHAANGLTRAQHLGVNEDIADAQERLLRSLNQLAATNVEARQHMLMLNKLGKAVSKKASA